MAIRKQLVWIALAALIFAAGCGDEGGSDNNATDAGVDAADASGDAMSDDASDAETDGDEERSYPLSQCDPVDPNLCSLP